MGKRPKGDDSVCVAGFPIANELKPDRPEWMRPGNCQSCNAGPLHSPNTSHAHPMCAFMRVQPLGERSRLCRDCAIAYDFIRQGHTRIEDAPFQPYEWANFISVYERGRAFLVVR